MSFQNQSGDLMPFSEVVPASAQFGALERSSILTQRRRCRITPQTGPSAGPSSQVQLLVSDQGGMLDPRSVVLNYTILVSGAANPVKDDGHPFMTVQALCNGQLLENITNAPKVANVEMFLGGSKSYMQTAGSLQGWELLNNDLVTTVPTSAGVGNTAYGYVAGNVATINTRQTRAAAAVFNNIAGEQNSIPLGLISGLGRMRQYIPIALIGEIAFVLQTGSAGDVLFSTSSSTDATYTLTNISLEYDIVVPNERYFSLLQKIAMEDGAGLVMPYESTVVSTGGVISASATLQESVAIVSRATNNLLRASVVQIPTTATALIGFPSQSCFGHAGVYSVQYRVGSLVFPQVAAQGDASLFNMSLSAYGSVQQENGTAINRSLWGNSTNGATAGTIAVYETAEVSTGGTLKFAYADKFIPTYGFQVVKGAAEPLQVDGISLAGASGSQLIVSIVSAPGIGYTPYVLLTALRYIVAKQGAVSVQGA